jgi:hypothetical protein
MAIAALVEVLNASDVMAFPQKANPKRVSISAKDTDNVRYFLTRVASGVKTDGTPNYIWAKGRPMRQQ